MSYAQKMEEFYHFYCKFTRLSPWMLVLRFLFFLPDWFSRALKDAPRIATMFVGSFRTRAFAFIVGLIFRLRIRGRELVFEFLLPLLFQVWIVQYP